MDDRPHDTSPRNRLDDYNADSVEAAPFDTDGEFAESSPEVESTSQQFLGRWNTLVSQTNWEKGRIILEWRQALIEQEAPAREYSDEAWSQRVGNVSSQHVGRLRRVFERFGSVRNDYDGLYWSHFQAALDWHDAEMWLEGAVQTKWSVSQMRAQRWEALGAPADSRPRDEDVITGELDEDASPGSANATERTSPKSAEPDDEPVAAHGEFDDDSDPGEPVDEGPQDTLVLDETPQAVRPFADLPDLPDDLADAFDSFKLAILRHKMADWEEITLDDVLASLDALKQLAAAPAD